MRTVLSYIIKSLISLSLLYLLIEFVLFYYLLPYFPHQFQNYLHKGLKPFAQSSKSSVVPQGYIAFFGDSFSMGLGDWLLTASPLLNLPHSPADVVYQHTGEEVISFGRSGSGSMRGFVTEPIAYFTYLRQTSKYNIPLPKEIFLFFYEGNDLINNINEPIAYCRKDCDKSRIYNADYFRKLVFDYALPREGRYKQGLKGLTWKDELYFYDFLQRALTTKPKVSRSQVFENFRRQFSSYTTNRAEIAGKIIELPDSLHTSAHELVEEELKKSYSILRSSLEFIREEYKGIPVTIVYIPSTITSYKIASPKLKVASYMKRETVWPTEEVFQFSDKMADTIRLMGKEYGFAFLDGRPAIRESAQKAVIHGPVDWKHLNKIGYTALGKAVSKRIKENRS